MNKSKNNKSRSKSKSKPKSKSKLKSKPKLKAKSKPKPKLNPTLGLVTRSEPAVHHDQNHKVLVSLPPALLTELDEMAKETGNNRSEVIRLAVNLWLKERDNVQHR